MTTNNHNQPVKRFRAGKVSAAIWRSETERDGQTVIDLTASVQKRYKDRKTDEWKTTETFFAADLADLELVARRAREFIHLRCDNGAGYTSDAECTDA